MTLNKKPKIIIRNPNNIVLDWGNEIPNPNNEEYTLQMWQQFQQWRNIYWGCKTLFNVENLEPCVVYSFRIRLGNSDEWCNFKGATQGGPYYFIRHLSRAIRLGKVPVIRKIVQQRPYLLEIENKHNVTPLIQAVQKDDYQLVALLIHIGVNINNALMYTKKTPLMYAVFYGNIQIVKLLVDKGGNINATDVNGLNILHYAVDSNNIETVRFVLNLGIDVNSTDRHKLTPILRSAILEIDQNIIDLLSEHGANKKMFDRNFFDYEKHCELRSNTTK